MAHKGKYWRVEQRLRIFNVYEVWPEWIPHRNLITMYSWHGSIPLPADQFDVPTLDCSYDGFSDHYEFRTANIGPGPQVIEMGFQGKVNATNSGVDTIMQV